VALPVQRGHKNLVYANSALLHMRPLWARRRLWRPSRGVCKRSHYLTMAYGKRTAGLT
jgi:hypothetical protein